MSMTLTGTKTALGPNLTASFLAVGGTGAVTYSVRLGGAGGSINAVTGLYTAPTVAPADPVKASDVIIAVDSLGAKAQASILVGSPLLLFCEIIEREMGLARGRVWIWDQKVFQPTDASLYIAVVGVRFKPFANRIGPAIVNGNPDWSQSEQSINVMATLDVNVISRSTEALLRKEEVLLALNSAYSNFQQDANSIAIGRLPAGSQFIDISQVDGAAIPYRFKISVNMQYAVTKQKPVDYFDTFDSVSVTANP